MDPQKNPPAPQPGDDPQNANPTSPVSSVSSAELSEEAAHTPASVAPVAGQKIEPETSAPDAAAPVSAENTAPPAAKPDAEAKPSDAPPQNQPTEPAPPAGTPADPLPIGQGKRRKKGLFIGLIVAAVIVLLSGGAAAAYYGYYLPNKPENVLRAALANSFDPAKAKTVHLSGHMTVEEGETDVPVKVTFQGAGDNESGAIDIGAQLDVLLTKITFDARSVDGKTLYFKVGGLDGLSRLLTGMAGSDPVSAMDAAILEGYTSVIESVNEQWFEVSESLIQQFGGASGDATLSESDLQKIKDIYLANEFLVVKEKLADEAVKGVNSFHYKVGIDKTKFKSFMTNVSEQVEALELEDWQLEAFNSALDELNFNDFAYELWIAKSDKMVRQMAFTYAKDGDKLDAKLTIESYNQPVKVEKPANAKSVMELLSEFMVPGADSELTLPAQLGARTGISL